MEETESVPLAAAMRDLGRRARAAVGPLGASGSELRDLALTGAAGSLRARTEGVLRANALDMAAGREKGLSAAMLDRLLLNSERVEAMAAGLEAIAALPDPLGRVLAEWKRPNGLSIQRIAVPLGVIGIIYESRPNVTADAAGLCLKAGNPVILRGGSESFRSNMAIHEAVSDGVRQAGLPSHAVQIVPTTDRDAVGHLLSSLDGTVDVIVPRGGKRLIERVQNDARVPVIGHLEGLCHVYLHESADAAMAASIVTNAKMRRTGICGAAETILVDKAAARRLLPAVVAELTNKRCEIRGDRATRDICPSVTPANDGDWSTEYLDAIIACRVVDGIDAGMEHIARYGSGHTDCIVADDVDAAEKFLTTVDSAIVLHNASTQFADGGEFGMGAEIGIATGRIHARGPVGANELTSYKYAVRGSGQVREP